MNSRLLQTWLVAFMVALLSACGGGSGDGSMAPGAGSDVGATTGGGSPGAQAMGTLRLSLTDSPACGYDQVWVTVTHLRVHRSSTADAADGGWVEIPLAQPLKVDLLTLTNGTLVPLGQVELPAGTYNQLRLLLADTGSHAPWANEAKPIGGAMAPLTTPSAQQSGLKLNAQMTVPPGQVADFAIDFDACRSIHTAGKSGKTMLKPVLSVIPMLSPAGQRIQGWLDPSLAVPGTRVAVQVNGEIVRATPPLADGSGKFVLYPVPVGTYDLMITSPGRASAVITGVPSLAASSTTLNAIVFPIHPPASPGIAVSGQITVGQSTVDTGGLVRALQTLGAGPTVEVASAGARPDDGLYTMTLPAAAPVRAPYVDGAVQLLFVPIVDVAGRYRLSATVAGSPEVKTADIVLDQAPLTQDFLFAAP